MAPFKILGTISYSHSIATMAVYLAICEIFSVKNGASLKTGLGVAQDHWKWRRSLDHIRLFIGQPL